jgi:hypothetical protein
MRVQRDAPIPGTSGDKNGYQSIAGKPTELHRGPVTCSNVLKSESASMQEITAEKLQIAYEGPALHSRGMKR